MQKCRFGIYFSILLHEIQTKIMFSVLNLRKFRGEKENHQHRGKSYYGIQSDFCWLLLDFHKKCHIFRGIEVLLRIFVILIISHPNTPRQYLLCSTAHFLMHAEVLIKDSSMFYMIVLCGIGSCNNGSTRTMLSFSKLIK